MAVIMALPGGAARIPGARLGLHPPAASRSLAAAALPAREMNNPQVEVVDPRRGARAALAAAASAKRWLTLLNTQELKGIGIRLSIDDLSAG